MQIDDNDDHLKEKGRVVLVLSPLSSLCLPELKDLDFKNIGLGTKFLNYLNQVHINSSQGSFDWFRFEILNKIFINEPFLKKLTKKNLSSKDFWSMYINTPYSNIKRHKEVEGRVRDLFAKKEEKDKKNPELNYLDKIITDVEEFKNKENIIFVRPIEKVRSILKLKRNCSSFTKGVMNAWLSKLKDEIN